MLADKDLIFTNVYGFQPFGLKAAQARGDWDGTKKLMAIGQDEESRTLTQAVRWFAEDRVLLDGARTIVFR